MTDSLTKPLYQGPPNLSNPQPALYTIPRSCPCFNAPPKPKDLQQPTTGKRNWPGKTASMTSALSNPKKRSSFSSKLWVLNSQILTTSCSSLWILPRGIMDRGGKMAIEN
ncbi:hypothetical protein AMTRI_Chr11g155440 [Amborella trichopoda]